MRLMTLAALLPLAACGNAFDTDAPGIPASGTGNVRTFDARDFTAVNLGGSDNVDVRVGNGYSVRAEGDPAVLDMLRITRDGDALHISRRAGRSKGAARILVTLPALKKAAIGGSGNMTIDRVQGDGLDAKVGGSGNMTIGDATARSIDITIGGSGGVSARGTAERLSAHIAGSGSIDARKLTARSADVKVAGSGSVHATVNGSANVRSIGSGDIDLGPDARCTIRKAGSGEVRCGG